MLEVRPPNSLRGWEALVFNDPNSHTTLRGTILSDEYSDQLQSSVLTIDWIGEPPEIVMIDHEDMMKMEEGYLLIQSAGRSIGFIRVPLIHSCGDTCTFHSDGMLGVE